MWVNAKLHVCRLYITRAKFANDTCLVFEYP